MLVVDPAGHNRYSAARFLVAAVVIIVGVVAARPIALSATARRLVWVITASVLCAAIAGALGPDPLLSALGDSQRLFGVLPRALLVGALVLGASIPPPFGIRRLQGALSVAVSALAIVGGVEMATSGGRVAGTLGNPGFLAAFLCLALPAAASRVLSTRGAARYALALAVALAVVVLVSTGTRAGWLGVGIGAVLLATLALRRGRRWRPRIAATLAVACVALVILVAFAPVGSRGRAAGTARGRLDTWHESIGLVAARPVFGWGPESFRVAFERSVSERWVRRYGLDQLPDRAHNRFVDVAATTGAVGLAIDALALALVADACRKALRLAEGDPARWWAVAGLSAGLAAWLVQDMFWFDTIDISIIVWLVVGAVAAATMPDGAALFRIGPRPRMALVMVLVLVAAVGAAGFAADRVAVSARRQDTPAAAIGRIARASRLRPRQLDLQLAASAIAIRSGDIVALRRAHELLRAWADPDVALADADVISQLARRANEPALLADAATTYREVIVKEPNNGLAWLGLGETLVRRADVSGARRALETAFRLLPRSPYPALDIGLLELASDNGRAACDRGAQARAIAPRSAAVRDFGQRLKAADVRCP